MKVLCLKPPHKIEDISHMLEIRDFDSYDKCLGLNLLGVLDYNNRPNHWVDEVGNRIFHKLYSVLNEDRYRDKKLNNILKKLAIDFPNADISFRTRPMDTTWKDYNKFVQYVPTYKYVTLLVVNGNIAYSDITPDALEPENYLTLYFLVKNMIKETA
ncbi:MAG: hypothetical protein AB7V16_07040 [Vulcanibacillus sp.]